MLFLDMCSLTGFTVTVTIDTGSNVVLRGIIDRLSVTEVITSFASNGSFATDDDIVGLSQQALFEI